MKMKILIFGFPCYDTLQSDRCLRIFRINFLSVFSGLLIQQVEPKRWQPHSKRLCFMLQRTLKNNLQ